VAFRFISAGATSLALAAIRFYQIFISPRKGYRCAYAAYTGRCSCSRLGYRAIRRYGVWHGLSVLDGRLDKCGVAYRRYRPLPHRGLQAQAGFLDCACESPCEDPCSCTGPGCGGGGRGSTSGSCTRFFTTLFDVVVEVMPCDCDWKRKRRNERQEREIVIPPRRN
jgi:uncharacterized protein